MQKKSNADWKQNRHSTAADGTNEPAEFKTPSSMQRGFVILYANIVATHLAKAIPEVNPSGREGVRSGGGDRTLGLTRRRRRRR
ncbi:hypothetical protein ACFXTH_040942 [Malus domestica]